MLSSRALPSAVVFSILIAAALTIVLIAAPLVGTAQDVKIKKVSIKSTDFTSGKQMYTEYCAPCHGLTGKGDGPAAPALKMPTTNLTQLAKNNGGKYPARQVAAVLAFGSTTPEPAHGSKDMPVWGPLFRSLHRGSALNRAYVNLRIDNVCDYLETLQAK